MRLILNRYLVKEILSSFFLILTVITVVLLLGRIFQVVDFIINKGIGLGEIMLFICLLLPSLFLYSLPISLLFAILVALGRLSSDNELTILKTSGMSLYQISLPVLMVAFLVFVLALSNSYFVLPWGNFKVHHLMYNLACKKATAGIVEKTFNDDFSGIVLYADRVPANGEFLEGVFISDFRHGAKPVSIVAHKAFLIGNEKTMSVTLRLQDGSIHMPEKAAEKYRRLDFKQYDVKLDFGPSITEGMKKKASREMSVEELKKHMKSRDIEEREKRELEMELYERLSIPFASIFFAIVAIPSGIKKHRAARYRGFTIGLMVVLAYYVLRGWGLALGEEGVIHPFLGAWLPNIFLSLLGTFSLLWAAMEISPSALIKRFLKRHL
ncbi:MAG TPA: LPS export ABC transporter permease LptF [Syntrophales bacterium]|nr:LPS export ABC transporter permease LptF [Syntrophales bacterium]HOL59999.1 LPS export ABC transporter permease LptF [Syntrophales bacterium]HPO36138.1 LPS export ABC transporter permease LptF [Syntrophales bacterium]